MKIYLASNNLNKKREMSEILSKHQIVIPADENIDFDPEETGTSFFENSLIKAKALYQIVHAPVLADDSGICVEALNGIPGIYSSRYWGPDFHQGKPGQGKCPQSEQNRMLIEELNEAVKNNPSLNRNAHYTCAMVFYLGKDKLFLSQETMEGCIIDSIKDARGDGGFGYDPIFYLPELGKTAAELSSTDKNKISHRGKALKSLINLIENYI